MDPQRQTRYGRIKLRKSYRYHQSEMAGGIFIPIFKKGKVNDMGDMMSFPETPEEFLKEYSFKDKKGEYTNGSELIPVFRVEQMIDYYFRERR
nr:MAG TPA: hypothetical protein [Caudoviricetes sp.]